jgi:hypothetical protein
MYATFKTFTIYFKVILLSALALIAFAVLFRIPGLLLTALVLLALASIDKKDKLIE